MIIYLLITFGKVKKCTKTTFGKVIFINGVKKCERDATRKLLPR